MNDQSLILADENLAGLAESFGRHGRVVCRPGRQLGRADLEGVDTLLVRSVTPVNAALLRGTPVRFVGSATIGTDHLAVAELQALGITVAHAPGCNAQAVAEYVIHALLALHPDWARGQTRTGQPPRLGIVGLGNVGRRLAAVAQRLGWAVWGHDPWVNLPGVPQQPLEVLLAQCDAVSLHVPLTRHGPHPTFHLLNHDTLRHWGRHTTLINSARGAVIEEAALLAQLASCPRPVVLDVFEHEPCLGPELLSRVQWVTPHIAGYSQEGKLRGTQMIYAAWCAWRGMAPQPQSPLPALQPRHQGEPLGPWLQAHRAVLYDIRRDDAALRDCTRTDGTVQGVCFDHLRKTYPLRREWSAFGVDL